MASLLFYLPTITDAKQMFLANATVLVITTFLAITSILVFAIVLVITKDVIINLSENNICHEKKTHKLLWAKTIQKHEAHPQENSVAHACLVHKHYLVAYNFFCKTHHLTPLVFSPVNHCC